jgi:hypothetical protein
MESGCSEARFDAVSGKHRIGLFSYAVRSFLAYISHNSGLLLEGQQAASDCRAERPPKFHGISFSDRNTLCASAPEMKKIFFTTRKKHPHGSSLSIIRGNGTASRT